jgi:hypothetical protein
MYYNIQTQEIVNSYPSTLKLSNGTVISGENFDTNILASAGYYTIRNDLPIQPSNSIENITERVINFDGPYVDITRIWILLPQDIPNTISARQIRLWLIDNNFSLQDVENAINQISDTKLKEKTLVEWEYAPYVERFHPLVNTLGQVLGLNTEQIDNAFIQASQL